VLGCFPIRHLLAVAQVGGPLPSARAKPATKNVLISLIQRLRTLRTNLGQPKSIIPSLSSPQSPSIPGNDLF
jgi:hypothetical protein